MITNNGDVPNIGWATVISVISNAIYLNVCAILINIPAIIKQINSSNLKVISIDIPSGINGNTGKIMGIAVKANRTIVLYAKKKGHVKNPGKSYSGRMNIIDIGIKTKE